MKLIQLRSKQDSSIILYEGTHKSAGKALEYAINYNVNLDGADLRNTTLCNISLDGAKINGADFSGANLTGANLSEAELTNCNFSEAALYNACFSWSDLSFCNFRYALMGATDISGAVLNGSLFAGLSTFSLKFRDATSMKSCHYSEFDGKIWHMSSPPIVVLGLERDIVLVGEGVLVGNSGYPFADDFSSLEQSMNYPFIRDHSGLIRELSRLRDVCEKRMGTA